MQNFLLQKSAILIFLFLLGMTGFLLWGNIGFWSGQADGLIQDAINGIKNTGEIVFNEAKFIFSQINPFQAGLAPNIAQTFQENEEITEEIFTDINEIIQESSDLSEDDLLLAMQDRLDDAREMIDILNSRAAELFIKNNDEQEKLLQDAREEKEKIIEEEVEDNEEDEEDVPADENTETAQKIEQKLCEKSVDNQPKRDKIIINEIAWMGTINSANDEWIELKNVGFEPVNLTGWQLVDKDKQIKVVFNSQAIAPAQGFFLLERTDDTTIAGTQADLIYQGGLNNTDEALFLFDGNCQLADEVLASPEWPAGDNVTKRTMEKSQDFGWQASQNPGGTPKNQNSAGYFMSSASGGGGALPSTPSPQISYPKILISEIQISPIEERFVEFYNSDDSEIDLSGWYVQRKTETGTSWVSFISSTNFEGKIIQPRNYFLVASSTEADIVLGLTLTENNSLVLKNPNREIVDAVGWGQAQDFETAPIQNPAENQALGRKWSTIHQNYIDTDNNSIDFEIQNPTPKTRNQSSEPQNQAPTAQFIYIPNDPIVGQEIIFDASSSTDPDGQISSFFWDFGDNNSTTTDSATTNHSFSASGEFSITLLTKDDAGATSSPAFTTIVITQLETPTLSVAINEIAWMGTNSQNSSDEWIELYNNTIDDIDLNGWTLIWSHGTTTRSLTFSTSTGATTTILAQKFFLLERTDDNAVSDISADQFFTGALDNGGEKLELRNAGNTLIDLIDAFSDWPAGTTTPAYISMERINSNVTGSDPANWADNNLIVRNGKAANNGNINGTPANQNSVSKTETEIDGLPFGEFDAITLTYFGNPYIIKSTLRVPQNKKLIVEPAVTLKFYIPDSYVPNEGAYLKVDGALEAIGEQGKEILFTSTGDLWPGIIFEAAAPETEISSVMEYVRIEKARTWEANAYAAVKSIGKAVSIKNSTFENYYDLRGLYLLNSSSSIENVVFNNFNASSSNPGTEEYPSGIFIDRANPTIKNNTFNNNYQGIVVGTTETCLQNPDFKISGNTFNGIVISIYITDTGFPCFEQNQIIDLQRDSSGNIFNGVVYQGANMAQDNLWQTDLPIILEKGFSVQNATLTVDAGVTVKFKYSNDVFPNTYLKIDNGSRLVSRGAADNLVIFTSNKETPNAGSWQAVWFADGSFGELNFTKISYGGFGPGAFKNECLIIDSVDVILNNVEKEFCNPYQ